MFYGIDKNIEKLADEAKTKSYVGLAGTNYQYKSYSFDGEYKYYAQVEDTVISFAIKEDSKQRAQEIIEKLGY